LPTRDIWTLALFAFRVRLMDPPPETKINVAPDICRRANKSIYQRLMAHCNCDAHLNPCLPFHLPLTTRTELP
jgi:hypothetical protein